MYRFTPEGKEARHPMAFMSFGHGPRNCIGMKMALMNIKFATVHLLTNFKLVTCEQTQVRYCLIEHYHPHTFPTAKYCQMITLLYIEMSHIFLPLQS